MDWKPGDELRSPDFDRHPLWGYDAARAEGDPAADDAWVRPYVLEAAPADSDVLFVRGRLRLSTGDVVPGAVLFAFSGGRPVVAGFALLEPSYFAMGLAEGRVTDEDRADLEEILPGALPLAYEATLSVGGRELRLSGAAR